MAERVVQFVVKRDLSYRDGVELQRRFLAAQVSDSAHPGVVIMAEHKPVITCGRSGDGSNLLITPECLAASGIEYHAAGRGGDVTYHGPGQWTVYPVLPLSWFGKDLHLYLRLLEECAIHFFGRYGVDGARRPGLTGVWVGDAKIAAIGVAVSKWITWHGLACNIHPDLTCFTRYMHPCGIKAELGGVASLDLVTGERHGMMEVLSILQRSLLSVLHLKEIESQGEDERERYSQ